MIQLAECHDRAEWNRQLAAIPYANVLQSWEWGEIKSRHGWLPKRLIWQENGSPCAAAQVLWRALPRTPYGILYVPKGPALVYDDTPLFDRVLSDLESHARKARAIFIKADPDLEAHGASARLLPARGWRFSREQIQFQNTVTLDLRSSEEDILSRMKPKWRYNIRLAEKKGVRAEEGTDANLEQFYKLYRETGARDGFVIREFPYYRDVWSTMLRGGLAHLLFARVGTETIAGLILFRFGPRAWYFYGASQNSHRDLMPNHLLQWEAIRWSKAQGATEYDFWGAPNRLEESQPMFGVYKFKMGFGGQFVERVGAFDFVVDRPLYFLYSVVLPGYLDRLRGKRRTEEI